MKTLLSLYDESGNWSQPFRDAGWNVIQWDIQLQGDNYQTYSDVREACAELFYSEIFDNYGTIDAVMIAQPCYDFAISGARWFADKDADGRTAKSIELVYISLAIVDLCAPDWWVLENPISRIHKLVPELGKPAMYFNPCDYGDPYTKKTALWGNFNTDLERNPVEPTLGSLMHKMGSHQKKERSLTPMGFARAFYEANKSHISQERLDFYMEDDPDYYDYLIEQIANA